MAMPEIVTRLLGIYELRIYDEKERRIISDGRKSYLALSDLQLMHTPLNSWSIRRFAQTDGINKSVAGFVEPMKEKE